jgi:hypothetical protein
MGHREGKYWSYWNLKCHLKKTKILVSKKGGKLKKNERCFMYCHLIETANEVSYLGATLESTGGWNKHKT